MKRLNRFTLVVILLVSSMAFSSSAMAWGPSPHDPSPPDYEHHRRDQTRGGERHGNAGAPLDGGLLTILAAAGIAYVGARKKKKNAE